MDTIVYIYLIIGILNVEKKTVLSQLVWRKCDSQFIESKPDYKL